MLETVDLADDERAALEGNREEREALTRGLTDTPTPAGPTPRDLGAADPFIPLTSLHSSPIIPPPDKRSAHAHPLPSSPHLSGLRR
jgi:hypothetical protein